MDNKTEAEKWPATGDDRAGMAKELLRLAKLPDIKKDKGGLVMQLEVAANLLCRADAEIAAKDRMIELYRRADLGHLFCWCVENLQKFPPLQGEWIETVKRRLGALDESVKLQSHYASLLNQYDGGQRMQFDDGQAWIDRLAECNKGAK